MTIIATYTNSRCIQTEVPTNGSTIIVDINSNDVDLYLLHTSTIASATILMPSDSRSIVGQRVKIWAQHEITNLSWLVTDNSGGTTGTMQNGSNTILAGQVLNNVRVGSELWTGEQ